MTILRSSPGGNGKAPTHGSRPSSSSALSGAAVGDLLSALVETAVERVLERMESAPRDPLLLTQAQAAPILGVSVDTLRRLLREGCPSVRVCETQRVIVADVIAWLKAREAASEERE